MKLGSLIKAAGADTYRKTDSFVRWLNTPAPSVPIDFSELKNETGYTKKAYVLLESGEYSSLRRKLFDKIIQSEKHDRYTYYDRWDENQKTLCHSALVYTADMLDRNIPMYEIADSLGLNPMTVMEICKFFNELDEDCKED